MVKFTSIIIITDLNQPRVIHIEDASDNTRRITMELRLSGTKWGTDAYIVNGDSKCTLAGDKIYDVNKWYNFAMTYSNTKFKAWVNGVVDDSGTVTYAAISKTAKISIGCRQNFVNYSKGAVRKIIFTKAALTGDKMDKSYNPTFTLNQPALTISSPGVNQSLFVITNSAKAHRVENTYFNLNGKLNSTTKAASGAFVRNDNSRK